MVSFWNCFGIILGSFWDYFGIILGSFWDHFGIVLGSFWDHFGIIFGYFWDHFVIILGSFWNHFGIVFGQFLNIFIFFESFGNGPGTILGYSLIVFGYIRTIPSPFSGKILKFYFSYIFPYISLYIYIYPHGVGGMGASPLNYCFAETKPRTPLTDTRQMGNQCRRHHTDAEARLTP